MWRNQFGYTTITHVLRIQTLCFHSPLLVCAGRLYRIWSRHKDRIPQLTVGHHCVAKHGSRGLSVVSGMGTYSVICFGSFSCAPGSAASLRDPFWIDVRLPAFRHGLKCRMDSSRRMTGLNAKATCKPAGHYTTDVFLCR